METSKKVKLSVIPSSNIESAKKIYESSNHIHRPNKILLHNGINDIDNTEPENIANNLVEVAENF